MKFAAKLSALSYVLRCRGLGHCVVNYVKFVTLMHVFAITYSNMERVLVVPWY